MERLLRSALALACVMGCKHRSTPPVPSVAQVPRVDNLVINGELDEPAWNSSALVAVFSDHGTEARPYSQIRVLHDAQHLYLGLYAADQDIHGNEQFHVRVGDRELAIDPRGHIAPPLPGATAAVDLDGTIDDPSDEDEEWVIELALPLPAPPFTISSSRCDTPKDGIERCGNWVAPAPLTLAP